MTNKYQHERSPDYQPIDEVRITTVPRFKTSGLSGDEWRISGYVQFFKKGILIGERSFNKVETAMELLLMMRVQWAEMGEGEIKDYRKKIDSLQFCDQEGCCEKATVFYQLKNRSCQYCGDRKPIEEQSYLGIPYVQFCEKHKYRGDSDLQDQDKNFIKIENPVEEKVLIPLTT